MSDDDLIIRPGKNPEFRVTEGQVTLEQVEPGEGATVYEIGLEPPENGGHATEILSPRAWFRDVTKAETWARTQNINCSIREGLPESYV